MSEKQHENQEPMESWKSKTNTVLEEGWNYELCQDIDRIVGSRYVLVGSWILKHDVPIITHNIFHLQTI